MSAEAQTPETDAKAKRTVIHGLHDPSFVSSDFARTLECERDEARKSVPFNWRGTVEAKERLERERDEARRERDALRKLADKYATVIAEYDELPHVVARKERGA